MSGAASTSVLRFVQQPELIQHHRHIRLILGGALLRKIPVDAQSLLIALPRFLRPVLQSDDCPQVVSRQLLNFDSDLCGVAGLIFSRKLFELRVLGFGGYENRDFWVGSFRSVKKSEWISAVW